MYHLLCYGYHLWFISCFFLKWFFHFYYTLLFPLSVMTLSCFTRVLSPAPTPACHAWASYLNPPCVFKCVCASLCIFQIVGIYWTDSLVFALSFRFASPYNKYTSKWIVSCSTSVLVSRVCGKMWQFCKFKHISKDFAIVWFCKTTQ